MLSLTRLNFAFVLLIAATVSACGMGYELLIARFLASLSADTVTSQSLTVGVFLLSLGFGAFLYPRLSWRPVWRRLVTIEFSIAIIAALSLPILSVLSLYFRSPRFFIGFAQIFPALIGVLCGIELPALIEAGRPYSKNPFGPILAANYLGALVASLIVPIVLVPALGLASSLWSLSLLSAAVAAACFLRTFDFSPSLRWVGVAAAIALPPWLTIHQDQIEQFYLKSFYYGAPASLSFSDFKSTLATDAFLPRIERFSSPYQEIDVIKDENEIFGSRRSDDFHLFIDQRNQFGSANEKIYHETIVHGSINIAKTVPRKVLVIGGGDGLMVRELLKYPEIQSIRLIELDAKMLELANHFKPLRDLNGGSLQNARVKVDVADGFQWLRENHEMFDAVFIDLPHPVSIDLSRLYSLEFYTFVRARLNDNGFAVFDFPFDALLNQADQNPSGLRMVEAVVAAVRGAGFASRAAFGSWETFMIATPQIRSLDFDYGKLEDKVSNKAIFNMATLRLPVVKDSVKPNSIFKPMTIKVGLDR